MLALLCLQVCATQASGAPSRVLRLQSNATITNVVLVAHQDDWQLFMGDILATRLALGERVVFVYLTAGDDGRDSAYWKTRERAALQSTVVASALSPRSVADCGVVQALGHAITKCDVGNTRSYFLRLPDGRRNGHGFAVHLYQSLRKLRAGKSATLSAIDGSAMYISWGDLAATVSALATIDSSTIVLHTMDPNVVKNPHDHFDHRMAGVLAAGLRGKNWEVVYYVGYALATRAANRSADQMRTKTELFLAYDREMRAANPAWSAYREHPAFYSACMQRTYSRHYPSSETTRATNDTTAHSP